MSFSALKLLGVSNQVLGKLVVVGVAITVGTILVMRSRTKRAVVAAELAPASTV